jgi:hypothetical protein
MRDEHLEQFAKLMRNMCIVWGRRDDVRELIEAYWSALSRYRIEHVRQAFADVMQTAEHMPRPATIVKAISDQRAAIRQELNRMYDGEAALQHEYWRSKYQPESVEDREDGQRRWDAYNARRSELESALRNWEERKALPAASGVSDAT